MYICMIYSLHIFLFEKEIIYVQLLHALLLKKIVCFKTLVALLLKSSLHNQRKNIMIRCSKLKKLTNYCSFFQNPDHFKLFLLLKTEFHFKSYIWTLLLLHAQKFYMYCTLQSICNVSSFACTCTLTFDINMGSKRVFFSAITAATLHKFHNANIDMIKPQLFHCFYVFLTVKTYSTSLIKYIYYIFHFFPMHICFPRNDSPTCVRTERFFLNLGIAAITRLIIYFTILTACLK